MSALKSVTDAEFEAEVLKSSEPVLVDFWAEWCAPCKALAPVLNSLANDYKGTVEFAKVDIDLNTQTRDLVGVRGIPLLALFKGGEIVGRLTGVQSRAKLTEFLDAHLGLEPGEVPEIFIPTSAFNGDAAIKQGCVERLRGHMADDTAMPGATVWDGENGSPMGCAAHGETVTDCTRVIGVPPSLIVLVDSLSTFWGTAKAGNDFALVWLEAVPVGADLSPLPLQILVSVLESQAVNAVLGNDTELASLRDRIVEMHRAAADGSPSLAQWSELRREVVETSGGDSTPMGNSLQAACGPIADPELLQRVLSSAAMAVREQAMKDAGWTNEDEQLVGQHFAGIHKELSAQGEHPLSAVTAEFKRTHPEFSGRFLHQAKKRDDAMRDFAQVFADMLVELSRGR